MTTPFQAFAKDLRKDSEYKKLIQEQRELPWGAFLNVVTPEKVKTFHKVFVNNLGEKVFHSR